MTVFIAIAVLLTLLVVAWMVRPLLRPAAKAGVSSQRLNAAIYRDQLQTLERDLARGAISPTDYETTQDELQLRLLDDTKEEAMPAAQARKPTFWTTRATAASIALLIPLGAAGMYVWLGTPAAIDPVATQKANDAKIVQMVETFAAKLKANPDNPKGWAMLARSYKAMGRLDEAEQAFIKAGDLVYTDPDLLVDYADLLAARAGNDIAGRPLALVNKALALNPQHPMALMMSGMAAYRQDNFTAAVAQWEKLLPLLEPESADAQQVEADIADARAKAGLPIASKTTPQRANPSVLDAEAGKLPPVDPAAAGAMTPEKITQMVERLAARLKANPNDPKGWAQLARVYRVQGRVAEADIAEARAKGGPDLQGKTKP